MDFWNNLYNAFLNISSNPHSELFWIMIGALGAIAGAIATFLAVWIALYQIIQLLKQNKPDLQLRTEYRYITFSDGDVVKDAIITTATNLKNYPINIVYAKDILGNQFKIPFKFRL